jgi:hypothetical protein
MYADDSGACQADRNGPKGFLILSQLSLRVALGIKTGIGRGQKQLFPAGISTPVEIVRCDESA